jgi:hypothetical protein
MKNSTDLFGIPVPSTDKLFLSIVVLHILISMLAVISGLVAMLCEKKAGRHSLIGKIYYFTMLSSFISVITLSILSWPHNTHLLIIGFLAFASAQAGRNLAQARKSKSWPRYHTTLMGLSYIFLLTGFYIDNGKNLPFWNMFPQIVFWIFPSIVGLPTIIYVLKKHPLNRVG